MEHLRTGIRRVQSSERNSAVRWTPHRGGSPYTKTTAVLSMCIPKQQHMDKSLAEVKWGTEEKLASLGLKQNHREVIKQKQKQKKTQKNKNISESMNTHTKIYGLLTIPILHTILIPRKKEKEKTTRLITTQSKCLQPKTSKDFSWNHF